MPGPSPYRLLVIASGEAAEEHPVDLDRDVVLVGRRAGVDVPLPHPAVAGVHLRLERAEGGSVEVVTTGAAPTALNGVRLDPGERRPLVDGDELDVAGAFRLRFQAVAPAGAGAATPEDTVQLARAMVREVLALLGPGAPEATPALEVIEGPGRGRRFELPVPGRELLVGRGESCDVVILDSELSREHIRIRRDWSGAELTDLGPKNGTVVAGRRLDAGANARLRHGDRIEIGRTVLSFFDPSEELLAGQTLARLEVPAGPGAAPAEPRPRMDEAPSAKAHAADVSPPGVHAHGAAAPGGTAPAAAAAAALPPAEAKPAVPTPARWPAVVMAAVAVTLAILVLALVLSSC